MPLLCLLILLTPTIAFGQDTGFVPLVGIPYVDTQDQATTLGDYVNGLYWASISIAAVLAFLKITWAGIKYMMSEIVTDKQSAKSDIKGALLGLIIILAAVLILDTINPEIKKLTALNLVPLKGDVTQPEEENCTATMSDLSGNVTCIAEGDDVCDTSLGGGLCNCGEQLVGVNYEPGYTCQPIQDNTNPETSNEASECVTDAYSCPCGYEANFTGNGDEFTCDLRPAVIFEGEVVDTSILYTIDEPAMPEYDIPEGDHHGKSGQIIGTAAGSTIAVEGETDSSPQTLLIIELTTGEEITMPCGLITPSICL